MNPSIQVVAAIIRDAGRILITRRPSNVHLAGLWEFPGGKVEANESLEAALIREIVEEIDLRISVGSKLLETEHHYPEKSVRLHFYECFVVSGHAQPIGVADLRWIRPEELGDYAFPEADRELIELLRREFAE